MSATAALRGMPNRALRALGEYLFLGPSVPPMLTTRKNWVETFQGLQGLNVDGWPGDHTYYRLWAEGFRPTTPSQIVLLALSWCNVGTTYQLGQGGYQWLADWPAEELDCSGFVASVLGRSRKPQPDFPWWLSTDSIWTDCGGKQILFRKCDPTPGAIVVYPDANGREGHVGFITAITDDGIRGVDCAASSSREGDAITERDLSFFLRHHNVRCCVPNWLQGDS